MCHERAKDALLQLASAIHLVSGKATFYHCRVGTVDHLFLQAGALCSNMTCRLDVRNLSSAEI
jgi:hypothetical protein